MLALIALLGQLAAASPSDSLMVPGVSHALARYRATHVRDVRYDLTLNLLQRDTATGRVSVTFTRVGGGDVILDFRGYELSNVQVNGASLGKVDYNGAHLRVAERLVDGPNRIDAKFKTPIAPAGAAIIRFTDDTDKNDYLYTLLVPSDANLLFPCFDQPDLKAVFSLTVEVKPEWMVLSNGATKMEAIGAAPQQVRTFVFNPTRPISTYLFAFAAGPYQQLYDAKRDMALWVRRSRAREVDADSVIAMNRRAKSWLAQFFGVPYPFEKMDFLLAPAFPFGGMEHPGAIFYNEESFIFREPPTLNQKLGRQATINHEVAHQWFGDYATMKWFDDLWLKEGFATYMAAKMQAASGDSTAWMSFYLRNKPTAYDVDASLGTTPVWQELANLDQAKSNYGAIVYNKAPGVLKQLNYLVGDAAFKKGVHDFLVAHAYGNGTWQELVGAIGKAAGRDLTSWGRTFFERPGMPIIEQQLEIGPNGRIKRLALIQRPAQASVSGNGPWPMKVEVRVQYAGKSPVMLPVEITSDTTIVAGAVGLPKPFFVYANAGDHGYGLVMLDPLSANWSLANRVDVPDRLTRAMVWGSLWDMVRAAIIDPWGFASVASHAVERERDEQIAARLMARVVRVVEVLHGSKADDVAVPPGEAEFLAAARDTTLSYGLRKNFFDSYVALARTSEAHQRLDAWLDSASAAGMPLRQPTRWSIVTRLASVGAPSAAARLAAEASRDTTTGGKRRAFIAGAAFPRSEVKRAYFDRYFRDSTLNEDWVTASLGAFNSPDHDTLTIQYLRPALDTLPWIQKNRRIFFLGAWLNAFIGGQKSPEALAIVDKYLAEHPDLPRDLRLKVLQARDDLERTVRIRNAFP